MFVPNHQYHIFDATLDFFSWNENLEPKPTLQILQNNLKQMVHKIAQTNKINKQAYNTIDAIIQTKSVYFTIQVLIHLSNFWTIIDIFQ